MPVIGRLDEQVNDVLIDPVGKRRRRRDDGEAAHPPSNGTRRGAADEDASGVARDADDEQSRTRTGRREDRARDDEQLPVWLL